MPAVSKKQRRMMAIAEHEPGKLYKRNKGVLSMGKSKLSEFASVKERGMPSKVKRHLKRKGLSRNYS